MDYLRILGCLALFLLGFVSCTLFNLVSSDLEMPVNIGTLSFMPALNSPGDWIKEGRIHVYENAVVIDVEGASLARYAPTGSMRPVLDDKSTGIRIQPKSQEQINVGDIVTFEKNGELIVHRVIDRGEDSEGVYFITKGDNNDVTDGKIRFEDIKYVTIGVLW
ncbi:hypothetical protein A3K73_02085 [Candidatus Pacearchaeota archaeon RBG_13_36_9]|nr:MAG: hypothetical protein A3K73_02085 [Candidatus Pacearchaeota archaeon RBG_13_36_9]